MHMPGLMLSLGQIRRIVTGVCLVVQAVRDVLKGVAFFGEPDDEGAHGEQIALGITVLGGVLLVIRQKGAD